MTEFQVCFNAFAVDPATGDESYADPDSPTISGWSVYVRTNPEGGQFDVPEEVDVDTREQALATACQLAKKYGTEDIWEF